jgi:hypothetical protein
MRIALLVAVLIALPGTIAGCNKALPVSGKPASNNTTGSSDIRARFDAALAITDIPQRNSTLATVAGASAAAGESDVVKKAIDEITDIPEKNRTAAAAALVLAGGGKRAEATEVANLITDTSLRNETLARLAKGEPGG